MRRTIEATGCGTNLISHQSQLRQAGIDISLEGFAFPHDVVRNLMQRFGIKLKIRGIRRITQSDFEPRPKVPPIGLPEEFWV